MNKLMIFIQHFIENENGLTAVEYAIAGGLVVAALVGAFVALGNATDTQIDTLTTSIGGTPPT